MLAKIAAVVLTEGPAGSRARARCRTALASLSLALGLSLASGVARAEETPPIDAAAASDKAELDKAQAASFLNNGNTLFEKGDYAAALAKYEKAYATYASPKILFNIGEAHNKLEHPVEAAEAYERFLAEAKTDPASPAAKKVRERLDALKAKLAYLEVTGDPIGAELKLDGKVVGTLPLAKPLRVKPGQHDLAAAKPGFEATKLSVDAPKGVTTPVEVKLGLPKVAASEETPPIGPAAEEATTPRPIARDEPVTSKWWFWGAIGLAAVAAGTGIAVAASSGGSDYVPTGELGASSTASWTHF